MVLSRRRCARLSLRKCLRTTGMHYDRASIMATSLAKRLGELGARLCLPIRSVIFGPGGKVPRAWIDTRNYYTHWDEELRSNVLDGQGMVYAHLRMRHFLRALYLDLAGVPQSAILEALRNTSIESQYLIQINAME